MPNLGTTEIIIIAIVIMVLFGAKRLPDAARALGRSARILKAETKGLHDDDAKPVAQPPRYDEHSAPGYDAHHASGYDAHRSPRYDPQTGRPLGETPDSSDRLS